MRALAKLEHMLAYGKPCLYETDRSQVEAKNEQYFSRTPCFIYLR